MSLSAVAQSPTPDEPIYLYRLDATSVGSTVHFFTTAINADGTQVVYGGQPYQPIDMEVSEFEVSAGGALPQPKMRISNTDENIQALVNEFGDLCGCELRRARTFRRFLDGESEADPTAYLGPDIFRVERKSEDLPEHIEWELSASFDQEGTMLPRRQFIRDVCTRRYRRYAPSDPAAAGDGYVYSTVHPCPYTASAAFDQNGLPTSASGDVCGKLVSDCKLRFGVGGALPFGGFPGIGKIR